MAKEKRLEECGRDAYQEASLFGRQDGALLADGVLLEERDDALLQRRGQTELAQVRLHVEGKLFQRTRLQRHRLAGPVARPGVVRLAVLGKVPGRQVQPSKGSPWMATLGVWRANESRRPLTG